jgi:hypothetical protein
MADFLLKAKIEMEQGQVDAERIVQFHRDYRSLVAKGEEVNPLVQKEGKSRGRPKNEWFLSK